MKGYIMLSEGRSGSNWLGSMANKTGQMGYLSEWLGSEYHDKKISAYSADEFFDAVMEKAQSKNGRFAIKVFPRHLHNIYRNLGFDFIRRCLREHDTKLVLLTRQDTIGQAISFVRGIQTGQWTSRNKKAGDEKYDFENICRAYFFISRSNQYWDAHLGVNQFPHDRFTYEELLDDPTPFLLNLQEALDVDGKFEFRTDLRIQRDTLSQEWREKFREDVKNRDIVGLSGSLGAFGSFGREENTVSKGISAIFKRLVG